MDLGGGVKLELVLIPAGEFFMGSPESDDDAAANERPQHRVRITKPFYLGGICSTQEQWQAVLGRQSQRLQGAKESRGEPSVGPTASGSSTSSTSGSAVAAGRFQLPTEAQWEYACRAGERAQYHFGDDEGQLDEYAWYEKNSGGQTHPVGEKRPNAWGLYDVNGNVWEWCADWWGPDYYANSPLDDPRGPLCAGHVGAVAAETARRSSAAPSLWPRPVRISRRKPRRARCGVFWRTSRAGQRRSNEGAGNVLRACEKITW